MGRERERGSCCCNEEELAAIVYEEDQLLDQLLVMLLNSELVCVDDDLARLLFACCRAMWCTWGIQIRLWSIPTASQPSTTIS